MSDGSGAEVKRIAAFCRQTARDGILPSLAWFTETAEALEATSRRDYFAGQALPAVIAARVAAGDDIGQESIAEECYELADALMAQRERDPDDETLEVRS